MGWLSRIIGSIGGALVGILLVVIAIPLLWWNEGRAVKTARGLSEGASAVIEVPADTVDGAHDGKLVHLTGQAISHGTVTDTDFNVSADAIKLVRTIETYQWHETRKTKNRSTTYTYNTGWSAGTIDSSSFEERAGHDNPGAPPWESQTLTAEKVTLGAFTLSPDLVALIDQRADRPVDEADAHSLPAGTGVKLANGGYYSGEDPQSPHIGDVRIKYQVVKPLAVSAVALERGTSLEAFRTKAGTSLLMLRAGTLTADDMFKAAQSENRMWSWIWRGVGFLLMLIGMALVLRPLTIAGSIIPVLGRLLSTGIGMISFLLALGLSLVIIALAWITARPLLTVGLLAAAAGALVLILVRHRSAMAAARARPASV